MSQAGYTPIQLYYSTTAAAVPLAANLAAGELAINIVDGKLYYENNSGVVTLLASAAGASGDVVGPASATDNAVARFDGTTGKLIQNGVVIVGDTGAVTGVTDLTASGAVTLSGGTANGVAYLNGSKVLTTGSALTFDGTNLGLKTSSGSNIFLDSTTTGTSNSFTSLLNNANAFAPLNYIALSHTWKYGATTLASVDSNGTYIWYPLGSEQMRLTSTGLGIGTSSPAVKLHVSGQSRVADSANAANYMTFGVGANASYGNASISTTTAGLAIVAEGAGNITFRNNGSEAMQIDTANNLGLGVTPSAWNSDYKALNYGSAGLLYGRVGSQEVAFGTNWYRNSGGSFLYSANGFASYQAQANGIHYWFTAPSGTAGNAITFTQAMTLDASGNLLVGTTTPYSTVTIGSTDATATLSAGGGNTNFTIRAMGSQGSLIFGAGGVSNGVAGIERARIDSSGNLGVGTTSPSSYGRVVSSGGTFSLVTDTPSQRRLSFWSTANGNSENAYIQVQNDGATTNTGEMLFATRNSGGTLAERARIDSSGVFLVGKTGASVATNGFRVDGSGSTYASIVAGEDAYYVYSTTAAAYRFYVSAAGTVFATNTTISAISDQRLKENIRDLDDGLDVVMALKPRKFDWKEGKGKDIKGDRGFIAQEFEAVLPEMIETWKDPAPEGEEPYKALNANLIPTLVKAIQEQQAIIESLKARLDAANL